MSKRVILIGPAYPYRGGIAAFNENLASVFQKNGEAWVVVDKVVVLANTFQILIRKIQNRQCGNNNHVCSVARRFDNCALIN